MSELRSRPWTVVQLIPAMDTGGAQRSTLEVAAALVAAGHRSIVISAGGAWVPKLTAAGSEHFRMPIGRKSLRVVLRIRKLRALLRSLNADLVHARSRLPAWLGLAAMFGMSPRPAFVTTVHGLNSVNAYSAVMSRGDRVIAVSETARHHLIRNYPRLDAHRIRVIPRGVDPLEFVPGTRNGPAWSEEFLEEFPQLRGFPLLTLPGRGTRLKGHAVAIDLLARLAQAGSPARLLLLGVIEPEREDYLAELRARAESLGVLDRVVFTPSRADVFEVYLLSDVVLQLSIRPESFGRVVIEALSLGRPVLGYAHGGVGELLQRHFPAGAVEPFDIDALTTAALTLLEVHTPAEVVGHLPQVSDLQRLTLAVYAELIEGAAVDLAFADGRT